MDPSRRKIFILAAILLLVAVFIGFIYWFEISRISKNKNVELKKIDYRQDLERRAAEMRKILEESNRQVAASSTLKKDLEKRSIQVEKQLEAANKAVAASSTLQANLNKSAEEMRKLLEQTNRQLAQ